MDTCLIRMGEVEPGVASVGESFANAACALSTVGPD
jgi:hypothetical protein